MWKRSRSIEELELSLTKRWGTDARPWTDYDDDDVDDDDGAPATTTTSEESLSSASSPAVRVRPVWDPWEADVDDRSADSDRRRRRSSPSEPGKFLVSDLIRDRPVGGRGTLRDPAVTRAARPGGEAAESSKAGFFFRRPTSVTVEATPTVGTRATTDASRPKPSKDKKQQSFPSSSSALSAPPTHQISREAETQQAADGTPSVARRSLPAAAKPLYDEADGVTPLFLTIQQAQRNFEKGHVDVHGGEEQETGSDGGADSDAFLSDAPMPATTSWKDLGVNSQALLDNLRRMECHQPLTVQRTALEFLLTPPGVDGSSSEIMKDLIIGTMTGSGKTLSFLVPLAERMIDSTEQQRSDLQNQQQVLIVAPGRELASQIVSVARDLLQGTGLTVQLAIGGTTYARNLEALRKRKPHFIVGTPGRLAELMVGRPGESKGRLAKIFKPQTLVLDEFDALLEYKPHREKALALLQVLKRDASLQTIVCSATASDMMAVAKPGESSGGPSRRTVIDEYLRPGYRVTTGNSPDAFATADAGANVIGTHVSRTVIHGVVHVPHRRYALETLRRVLHTEPLPQQVLVFVQDARKVKIVVERLERNGIIAAPLSGDDDKTDRADVSRALREGYVGLVVASELAARGLDAPLLTHVINMDLPTDASHYAHRAGRCGRGGRPGVVINFTTMPQERAVPRKLADKLGIDMHTVEVRNGKLNIVDPSTQTIDAP
jgi:superfamily II DNA/RNA helicase